MGGKNDRNFCFMPTSKFVLVSQEGVWNHFCLILHENLWRCIQLRVKAVVTGMALHSIQYVHV